MQYMWNNFSSPFFEVNINVGQVSALSPILLALYLSLFFYVFEKSLEKINLFLFCSYNIVSSLLDQFSLIIEHGKTEVFHFSRSQCCGNHLS